MISILNADLSTFMFQDSGHFIRVRTALGHEGADGGDW